MNWCVKENPTTASTERKRERQCMLPVLSKGTIWGIEALLYFRTRHSFKHLRNFASDSSQVNTAHEVQTSQSLEPGLAMTSPLLEGDQKIKSQVSQQRGPAHLPTPKYHDILRFVEDKINSKIIKSQGVHRGKIVPPHLCHKSSCS